MAWSSQPTAPTPKKTKSVPEVVAERYQIVELLGEGAMGTVFRARDLMLEGDEVALKLLRPELAREPIQRTRFLREVQYTRLVSHPNVVRTFDLAEHDGQLYFSMEVLRGETLYDYLQNHPYEFKKRLDLLVQLVSGLAAIHHAGVIHRDLKSTNILIVGDHVAKITDFGIARSTVSELTGAEEILGSAPYLPPEVWTGADISARSDLYALGVLTYELFTNDLPFYADSAAGMMRAHLSQPAPRLRERVQELPLWLDHLVKSLLEKEGAHRPRSAQAVLATIERHRALAEYEREAPINPAEPVKRSRPEPENTLTPQSPSAQPAPLVEFSHSLPQPTALGTERSAVTCVINVAATLCAITLVLIALSKIGAAEHAVSSVAWWMFGRSAGVVIVAGAFLAPLAVLTAWKRCAARALAGWMIALAGMISIWVTVLMLSLAQTRLASSDSTLAVAFELTNKIYFASAAFVGDLTWLPQAPPAQWFSLVPSCFLTLFLLLFVNVSRLNRAPNRMRFLRCLVAAAILTVFGLGLAGANIGTEAIARYNVFGIEIALGLLSLAMCALLWTLPLLLARLEGTEIARR